MQGHHSNLKINEINLCTTSTWSKAFESFVIVRFHNYIQSESKRDSMDTVALMSDDYRGKQILSLSFISFLLCD